MKKNGVFFFVISSLILETFKLIESKGCHQWLQCEDKSQNQESLEI